MMINTFQIKPIKSLTYRLLHTLKVYLSFFGTVWDLDLHATCMQIALQKKNLMATLKIIIDTRTIKKDNSSPVYLRLIHHRKTINIKIGLYINAMHWNKKLQNVKHSHPNAKRWNITLTDKRLKAEKILLEKYHNLRVEILVTRY